MRRRGRRWFSSSYFARCTHAVLVGHIGSVENLLDVKIRMKEPETFSDLPNTQEFIVKISIASTNLPKLITVAILSPLAFGCAALRTAGDNGDLPHAVVNFADLNVARPQGAAVLYNRIVAAAYDVCAGFDVDIRGLVAGSQLLSCVHKAVANAVTSVGRPELVAIYNARNRDPLPITVAAAQRR
jgi:UrcA family protein